VLLLLRLQRNRQASLHLRLHLLLCQSNSQSNRLQAAAAGRSMQGPRWLPLQQRLLLLHLHQLLRRQHAHTFTRHISPSSRITSSRHCRSCQQRPRAVALVRQVCMLLLQLLLPLLPGLQLLNCHMEPPTPVTQAPCDAVADLQQHR
jgi:hypothetical protein